MARWEDVDATFRPVERWPGALTSPGRRQRSNFRAPWSQTLQLLQRELRALKAKRVVVQIACEEGEIRNDGYPRSNARPTHPGVILAFESKFGPLEFAVDTFDGWEDNMRAIALGMEKLRAVDRYGVTKRGEQYTGWKALPSGMEMPAVTVLSPEEAAEELAKAADAPGVTAMDLLVAYDELEAATIEEAYRLAVKKVHPDVGGDADRFTLVTKAKEVLVGG